MKKVLSAQTANGSSSEFRMCPSDQLTKLFVMVTGTWDTATAKLEFSIDEGVTWVEYDSTNTTFTANGHGLVDIPFNARFRVTISSVGAGTTLNAWLGLNGGLIKVVV